MDNYKKLIQDAMGKGYKSFYGGDMWFKEPRHVSEEEYSKRVIMEMEYLKIWLIEKHHILITVTPEFAGTLYFLDRFKDGMYNHSHIDPEDDFGGEYAYKDCVLNCCQQAIKMLHDV